LEHLLSVWPRIATLLGEARRILLLTDYDGTLTPIVARPELAYLPEKTRNLLQALAQEGRFTVGVISGRALPDLKDKVNVKGIIYAGNHGLEIEGPGINFVNPVAEDLMPLLRIIYYVLTRTLGAIKGVLVEDKGLSLSVHYRQVAEDKAEEVKNSLEEAVSGVQAMGKVKITSGKKVYEVRPSVDWHKGKAIRLLMKRYGKGGRRSRLLPIYLGDDLTDEDGFKIIESYGGGISVFVGDEKGETAARYFLKSPIEVALFLGRLLEYAQWGFV